LSNCVFLAQAFAMGRRGPWARRAIA
jgi:hypothetical protein